MVDIVGTNSSETLDGFASNDFIRGLGGNDILNGLGGNDRLAGGTGSNTLTGGTGSDIFEIEVRGGFTDTITDFVQGTDLVDLRLFNVADLDTLLPYISQVGNDVHIETFFNDLNGSSPNEVIIIEDFSFNDLTASDFIFNTNNTDLEVSFNDFDDYVLFGGNGDDELSQLGSGDDELNGGAGNDILTTGSGNDTLRGGTGADELFSGSGDDILNGGIGNDTLNGDAGLDTLFGGDGIDTLNGGDDTCLLYTSPSPRDRG